MKKLVTILVVITALLVLIVPVSAKNSDKNVAEIKGPTTLLLGRSYKFQISCVSNGTNYMEFGFLSRISRPRIIKGGGVLSYDFEQFPGFLGWRGNPTNKLLIQFVVTPTDIGDYTVYLECWGNDFEVAQLNITVK